LEHLLFQGTYYKDFFPKGDLAFSSYANTNYLNIMQLGAAWEQPVWKGLGYLGLEAGYSSGSKFGGRSSMDFIPIMLNAGYDIPLGDFFSIGPNVKLGGYSLVTPIGNKMVPVIAGHVEGEFRYKPFPISLYAAGGVDFIPTASGVLPAIEVGTRFRPNAFINRSGSKEKSKATVSSQVATSGQAASVAVPHSMTVITPHPAAAIAPAPVFAPPKVVITPPPAPVVVAPAPAVMVAAPAPAAIVAPPPAAVVVAPPKPVVAVTTPAPVPVVRPPQPVAVVASAPPVKTLGGMPVVIDGRQCYLRSVYFHPDSDVLINASRPSLDAVGREMMADSTLRLILRAYTTPAKTPEGRFTVSVDRAACCQEYLYHRYGISSNRITSYYYGSDRAPLMANGDLESLRCVELIVR
jgi:outer membrane protein OmpA-like peptidoglycan-associated protein